MCLNRVLGAVSYLFRVDIQSSSGFESLDQMTWKLREVIFCRQCVKELVCHHPTS